jgi:hypothetical protein
MNRLLAAGLVAALPALSCCTVAEFAAGRPGTDLTPVHAQASKEDIETVIGEPERCWTNETSIEYCLYEVDAGRDSQPGNALIMLTLDIITLGTWELMAVFFQTGLEKDEFYGGADTRRIIVSYGEADAALGLFGEFDPLPEDGIPVEGQEIIDKHAFEGA